MRYLLRRIRKNAAGIWFLPYLRRSLQLVLSRWQQRYTRPRIYRWENRTALILVLKNLSALRQPVAVRNIGVLHVPSSEYTIRILIDPDKHQTGSTVMRAFQLAEIVNKYFCGSLNVCCYSFADAPPADITIVNKGALMAATEEEIRNMRRSTEILIGDPVDSILEFSKILELDAIIAASFGYFNAFTKHVPKIPVYMLTHHSDIRIPRSIDPPSDRLRIAYFGEPANTYVPESVSNTVSLHRVDTSRQCTSWVRELSKYNSHYCVRRRRPIDGFKPFLKGFTAATCRSVPFVDTIDGDVVYYLGESYPFSVDVLSPSLIHEAIQHMNDAFLGPEWQVAVDIMRSVEHKCSIPAVMGEFKAMLNQLGIRV